MYFAWWNKREIEDACRDLVSGKSRVFDANVGYKTIGRYLHNGELAKQLGLPEDRVLVVPKGTQADPYLLITARDLGARVVTNDRFRDWVEAHPEVCEPGLLIRGGYHEGKLWLEDGAAAGI